MMDNYDTWSPLFRSIVTSSIWNQPPHVKIVWVTMLALKDKNGFVSSSVSGLARMSVVSMEECQDALRIMLSPDDDSKCSEYEGIKIEKVEGGWMVLGHERFQKKMKEVSLKIGNAKRQKKHREKMKKLPLAQQAAAEERRRTQADRVERENYSRDEPTA